MFVLILASYVFSANSRIASLISPACAAHVDSGYLMNTLSAWLKAPAPLRLPDLSFSPKRSALTRSSSRFGFLASSCASFQSMSASM